MKKSTAVIALGTLSGSAFLVGCRSNTYDQSSQYDNSATGRSGSSGGYYGGVRSSGRSYSSPRGGFGSTGGSSSSGFFSGGG